MGTFLTLWVWFNMPGNRTANKWPHGVQSQKMCPTTLLKALGLFFYDASSFTWDLGCYKSENVGPESISIDAPCHGAKCYLKNCASYQEGIIPIYTESLFLK